MEGQSTTATVRSDGVPQAGVAQVGQMSVPKTLRKKQILRRNRRVRKVKASNPAAGVVPTSQRGRRLGHRTKLKEQEVLELLNMCPEAGFEKRQTQEMGMGLFYVGEGDLPANKDVFAYCDHKFCFKLKEYPYLERFGFSNKLVETVEDGEKWVFDGEQSTRLGPFVNHSGKKGKNLFLKKAKVQGKLVGYFCTFRAIHPGEELFWDYNDGTVQRKEVLDRCPWLRR